MRPHTDSPFPPPFTIPFHFHLVMPRRSRQFRHLRHARASKLAKSDPDQSLAQALADLTLSRGDHTDSEEECMETCETSDLSDDDDDFCAALEGLIRLQTSDPPIMIARSGRPITIALQESKPAERQRPFVYTGNSLRARQWRAQQLRESASGSRSILDYFATSQTSIGLLPLETCLTLINMLPFMATVQRKARYDELNVRFEIDRALAVRSYFTDWLQAEQKGQPFSKMAASQKAADVIYADNRTAFYRAMKIREWGDSFRQYGEFPENKIGCHAKVLSLITDEDIAMHLRSYLRSLDRTERLTLTQESFASWINHGIGSELSFAVSSRTAGRWMNHLGFHAQEPKKGIYVDGHEREDVVKYRKTFVSRMMDYKKRMTLYVGVNCETALPPTGPNMIAPIMIAPPELVLVSHDESVFSSHDGRRLVWMEDGKPPIRPKGDGQSLMVSEFLCPCHGRMKTSDGRVASKTIKIGANYDGYWTLNTMAQHLREAITIFEELHPGKQALFLLDNSSNHNGFGDDALRANRLKLSDGYPNRKGKPNRTVIMRDTVYYDSFGIERLQTFHQRHSDGSDIQKGLKAIMTERDLWEDGMTSKEAKKLLSQQPDFDGQMPLLMEIIDMSGHLGIFLPKFHPEFNFIERFWGAAKRWLRIHCGYTLQSLTENLQAALDSVSLPLIRKYCNHCWRYMMAYDQGQLSPEMIERAMRNFSAHRKTKPSDCIDEFNFLKLEFMRETVGEEEQERTKPPQTNQRGETVSQPNTIASPTTIPHPR